MANIQIGRLVKYLEIGARIYGQMCLLQPETYLSKEKHQELLSIVVKLMQKLEKTKYHATRCADVLRSFQLESPPQPAARHVDHTSGVEAEAEAFLLQAKATLDILAKVLRPTTGIHLRTFGEKGEKIISAMKRNVPADRQPRAGLLIRLIEEDKEWLTELINIRDTVGHFDGLESSGMSAELVGDKVVQGQPTDKSGRPIADLLQLALFQPADVL